MSEKTNTEFSLSLECFVWIKFQFFLRTRQSPRGIIPHFHHHQTKVVNFEENLFREHHQSSWREKSEKCWLWGFQASNHGREVNEVEWMQKSYKKPFWTILIASWEQIKEKYPLNSERMENGIFCSFFVAYISLIACIPESSVDAKEFGWINEQKEKGKSGENWKWKWFPERLDYLKMWKSIKRICWQ